MIDNNWERVTASGLRAFAPVFESSTSNLEMIRFDPVSNQAINDAAVDLSDSLVNNKKLKNLILLDQAASPTDPVSVAFEQVLFNKSSISSTFLSNHTLKRLGHRVGNLGSYLRMNLDEGKDLVARQKIMMIHFSGDINIQPFVDM